jgi:hypothetical protein
MPDNEFNLGQICYKVFSTKEGELLLGWMFDEWIVGPQQKRAFDPNPSFDYGQIAYRMGKEDAFYTLKGMADTYAEKINQLEEAR